MSIIPIVLLTLMAAATAYLANQRGRDPYIWFAIGLLLGFFGILILLILPKGDAMKTSPDLKAKEAPLQIISEPLSKEWFYVDKSGQQQGPISIVALQNLWKVDAVDPRTFVWGEGMPAWKRIEDLPELTVIMDNN